MPECTRPLDDLEAEAVDGVPRSDTNRIIHITHVTGIAQTEPPRVQWTVWGGTKLAHDVPTTTNKQPQELPQTAMAEADRARGIQRL